MAQINQGLDNLSPQAVDRSYGRLVLAKTTPYSSVAQANAAVHIAFRHIGKTVLIDTGGGPQEYWWKDGVADINLITKMSPGNGPESIVIESDDTYEIPEGYLMEKLIFVPESGYDLSIGLSLGSDDLMPSITLTANQANIINLDVAAWGAPQTIHFTGVTSNTIVLIYLRTMTPNP